MNIIVKSSGSASKGISNMYVFVSGWKNMYILTAK